jgi:hypothetical protein
MSVAIGKAKKAFYLGFAPGPMPLPKSIDTGPGVQHKEPVFCNVRGLRNTGDSL